MSGNIPMPEMKALFMKSGGFCAFPDCRKELMEPGIGGDETAITGEMAHIVGEKHQGPRGNSPMSEEDRNKESNLILLCPIHHKVIDTQVRTYTVEVLRKMKMDHEGSIRNSALSYPIQKTLNLVKDSNIHSTILPVIFLPELVFSAPCKFTNDEEDKVKLAIKYPENPPILCPFIIRENHLYSFFDLGEKNNPFHEVIDVSIEKPKWCRSVEMWQEAEGKRRYMNLLNRALFKYTGRLGIRYDPVHKRFFFPAIEFGKKREVRYRSMNKKYQKRGVVWQPVTRSTGLVKPFWWHQAARLQFHQFSTFQWGLSIRPERHLTIDSEQPLPANEVGPLVTALKSKMYNEVYLSEVVFWRDILAKSEPRIILHFGSQVAVIGSELEKFDMEWPGIPDDVKAFKNEFYQDDLFTFSDYLAAVSGGDLEWEEFEAETGEDNESEDDF